MDSRHPILGVEDPARVGMSKTELRLDIPLWMLDEEFYGSVWATVIPEGGASVAAPAAVVPRMNTIRLHVPIDDWPLVAACLRKLIDNADAVYRRDRPEAEKAKDAEYLRGFLTKAVQGG